MLSILVPSYNHAEYIESTLRSIESINVPEKKIYVIDDKSTDNSVGVIRSHIKKSAYSSEYVLICKKENKGVIDTLNMFIEICQSEYVYLMSSDDLVVSNGIEEIIKIMENNKSLKFVIGGASNLFDDKTKSSVYKKAHFDFFDMSDEYRKNQLYLNCPSPILSQGTIVRKHAIDAIGKWDDDIIADDYSMFLRLLSRFPTKGKDFLFLPNIECVKYRHHISNSYTKTFRQYLMTKQVLEKYAPVTLKKKAVARKLGLYFGIAVRNFRFRDASNMLRITKPSYLLYGFAYLLVETFRYVERKCTR